MTVEWAITDKFFVAAVAVLDFLRMMVGMIQVCFGSLFGVFFAEVAL